MLCTSSISIINVNDGKKGDTGTSILSAREQWYLSTSSSKLIGGSWSYTEPSSIPSGKYLWGRWEYTMSDNTFSYSDAVHRSVISGLVNLTDNINNSITNKVWQSDITQKVNEYDNTTGKSIRDRVTSTESNINGIWTSISDQTAQTVTKPDGTVVQGLAYKVHNVEDTADSHTRTIGTMQTDITKVKTDLSTLEVGGRNLLMNSDFRFDMNVTTSANPYGLYQRGNVYSADIVNTPSHNGKKSLKIVGSAAGSTSGSDILWQSTLVKAGMGAGSITGRKMIMSFWAKADSVDNESHELQPCVVGFRTAYSGYQERKYVTLTDQWQRYSIVITGGADDEKAVAAESPSLIFYSTVKCIFYLSECMLEMGSVQSDWVCAPEDTELEASTIRTVATQAADHFSWLVDSGTSASNFTLNSRVAELTASIINMNGLVTFNGLDSTAQQRITDIEDDVATNTERATEGLGIKVNYSAISTTADGQCYLHGLAADGTPADVNGYVYWRGKKITVPKKQLNPNNKLPFYTTIYIVLRLTNSTATTGNLYMVYYDGTTSNWKCGVTPSPSAVDNFGFTQATDIILGQFVLQSNGGKIMDAYLYNPPRGTAEVTTGLNSYQYSKGSVDWFNTNGSAVVEAKNILNSWKGQAEQGVTKINGGLIQTHTVMAEQLATNAIMSSNYNSGRAGYDTPSGPFSNSGSFLDLSSGYFYTPNFGVNNDGAFIHGEVTASSGAIGSDSSNYWEIGDHTDYDGNTRSAIIGHGVSYIQSGNWQISTNRINTQWYTAQDTLTYINYNNTYYDYGMAVPDLSSSYDYNKNFLYIRKHASTIPSLASEWEYPFRVTHDGKIYATDIIITGGGSGSTYLPLAGGTITGSLTVNSNLTVGGTITGTLSGNASSATQVGHSLTINGTSYNGSSTVSINTFGKAFSVNGSTTAKDAANIFINALDLGTASTLNDNVKIITQDTTTSNTTYYRRSASVLWNYIKGKIESTTLDYDSMNVTELTVGDLIVNGAGRFANGIIGTASRATADADGNTISSSYLKLSGGTSSRMTGNIYVNASNMGYMLKDATNTDYGALRDNGDNLWIGASSASSYHHKGNDGYTCISTGYSTSRGSGNPTVFIEVPTLTGTTWSATAYSVIHSGNYTDYTVKKDGTGATGTWNITVNKANNTVSTNLTIGKTQKAVVWSGNAISFSKAEISDNASSSAAGWMSSADKSKLDGLVIDENTGSIGISNIVAGNGINVGVNTETKVYTISTQTSYLPLSGGTMTGDLIISRSSTASQNYPARIYFRPTDTTNNITYTDAYVAVYDDHDNGANGTNMVIKSASNMVIGSGESPSAFYNAKLINDNTENMYVLSDSSVFIESNCNTIANRVGVRLNASHQLVPVVAEEETNNVGAIGTPNYKWANMYATTFHGALDGNATTATSATSAGKTTSTNLTNQDLNDYVTSSDKAAKFYYAGGSNSVKNNPASSSTTPSSNGTQMGMFIYPSAGGHTTQELASNGSKWIRYNNGTDWSGWAKFLTSSNYSSYALPLSGGTISGNLSVTGTLSVSGVTTHTNEIIIQTNTVGSNVYNSENPKLTFKNSGGTQNVQLVMTDYDSVVTPASLTLTGNQNGNNGGEYFIAPNIRVTSRMELTNNAYMEYVSSTKSINFVFR